MHSLPLWKEEPASPLSNEEVSLLDNTFYQSALDDLKFEDEHFEDCESKAEVASQILENLEKLVDLDELIKSEPSFLLDDKMLPLLDEVEPPRAVPVIFKSEYFKPSEEHTYLYNEFEKVYLELNNGTLTPPQSPPVMTTLGPLLGTYVPVPKEAIFSHVPEKQAPVQQVLSFSPVVPDVNYSTMHTPQPDIARGLAVVDELVRSTVEDMQWASGPSSPESSSNSSSFGDSSSSEDPEWIPEPIENCKDTLVSPVPKQAKKRSKPYSHNPDDKKNRKKEQNKNAATRYRMKKKAEVEEILTEEKQLQDTHKELDGKITDLQREIKYLKGLMRDLLKAKGVIN
ncbi:activating transcription factor of chaperone isoform X1 [Euwallacea fornicatus]|uniref:activating transcription factor of chaperone isoform X1 n=1 Tax=Euwallacea fornicatus TaxID=995702 RepID=UPI00338F721A